MEDNLGEALITWRAPREEPLGPPVIAIGSLVEGSRGVQTREEEETGWWSFYYSSLQVSEGQGCLVEGGIRLIVFGPRGQKYQG